MKTEHDLHDSTRRPARCLRHHVWMAYCGDCRDARTPLLEDRQATEAATRR